MEPSHQPGGATLADDLAQRIGAARARIHQAATRAGRDPSAVILMAASKTVGVETLRLAYTLGLATFGENRVQEAREKIAALPDARWELIGHLQSNKATRAVELFARIQSVDSVRLAEALSARAVALGKRLPILLEVNVGGEASKTGFTTSETPAAASAIAALPGLAPEGLMTIAPLAADPDAVRPIFRALRLLSDDLRRTAPLGEEETDGGWRVLSMGMSDDFEVAIEEGATLVRLGRILFGARPKPATPPTGRLEVQ